MRVGKFTIVIKKNPSNKPLPPRAEGTSAPAMRLATVREACDYGRFGHTKCYDYINEGKIVAYKRGRRTMIDLDSIDAFNASLLRITPPKEAVE
jgi:excisionase family DNA binding protein